jgi:alpha-galactosidase
MPVFINEYNKEFHLKSKGSSYIFKVLSNGHLGQLYYGKAIRHRDDFSYLLQLPNEPVGNASFVYEGDNIFTMEVIKQEYPSYGTTDYREPAIQVIQENGSRITDFKYKEYKLYKGKPKLKGLPATYVEDKSEASTLEIILYDGVIDAELRLIYSVFENYNAITRSVKITNKGKQKLNIDRIMGISIDLPDSDFEMLQLDGAWIRERHINTRALKPGIQAIDSKRGTCSSSQHNPFIALKRFETREDSGEVYGFSFVYSGNFLAQVEVDHYNTSRIQMGINPFDFNWLLEPGETFQSPEVVSVYSDRGLNGMSQTYHGIYRKRLARGPWRDRERPILINNWEATYFDFNEEKIVRLAEKAREVGIELFVLDDGWFEGRNDDTSSLGDWFVDRSKLANGLDGLAAKIRDLGMKFGIWFEPEMISENSKLYCKHPDWIVKVSNRKTSHGRNQYVLDFSRIEVREEIYSMIRKILLDTPISYVKWDMNRNMTEIGSLGLPENRQREVTHRYILGLYEILERLTAEFPDILFESCASGGNRFDPAMLYYMPQTWASDNTDAIERLKIQYGTSMVYPISSIGAHVSAVPNHQLRRTTPLKTRFAASIFGVLGYELDLNKLREVELDEIKEQIEFYRRYRELILNGKFYRLISPYTSNRAAWMVVSEDGRESILGYYKILAEPNPSFERIKLKGLSEALSYRINGRDLVLNGDELMNVGLLLEPEYLGTAFTENTNFVGDFGSRIFIIKAVD